LQIHDIRLRSANYFGCEREAGGNQRLEVAAFTDDLQFFATFPVLVCLCLYANNCPGNGKRLEPSLEPFAGLRIRPQFTIGRM
jgi:hypothetical protein